MYNNEDVVAAFSDEDLKQIAGVTKTNPEALRKKYLEAISDPANLRRIDVNIGEHEQADTCIKVPFDISFYEVLGVQGHVEFCLGDCYSAEVHVCVSLLGNEVACQNFRLDCNQSEICINVDVLLAKATICFGVRGSKVCFYIKGEACYWALGWQCEKFDETIVCLL